jgi:ParB family chromosome partitioning protein
MNKITILKIEEVKPDPQNPRQEFSPEEMRKLESSISRKGILQPLVVEDTDKGYLLIDGERRYRSAKKLGLKEVPVIIQESMSEEDRMIMRFNLQEQHTQWNAWEKSLALKNFMDSTGATSGEAQNLLGLSQKQVQSYQLISSLSKRTATSLMDRKLPFDYISEMGSISRILRNSEELRDKVEKALIDKIDRKVIMTARELRKYRKAISLSGEKLAEKIVNDPDYSPSKASKESGYFTKQAIEIAQAATASIVFYGQIALNNKHLTISTNFHKKLQEALPIIKELIDVDYEDPQRKKKDE